MMTVLAALMVVPSRMAEQAAEDDSHSEPSDEQRQKRGSELFNLRTKHGRKRMTRSKHHYHEQGGPAQEVRASAEPTPTGKGDG